MADLDELYGDVPEASAPQIEPAKMKDVEVNPSEDSDGSESGSDIEVIIETKPGQRAEPPTSKSLPYAAVKIQKAGSSLLPTTTTTSSKPPPVVKVPAVDVDAIAEMDGKSILEVDLQSLENKPWRQPGADITEYFNYGFDEFTWTAYCQKQTKLRDDFEPTKVMQSMMGAMDSSMMPPMNPGMMMPAMDPMMMQQFYGSGPMDFMQDPNAAFGGPMPPQGNFNGRQASNNIQAPKNHNFTSPNNHANDYKERSDVVIPKGPAQGRANYRPRGGSVGR